MRIYSFDSSAFSSMTLADSINPASWRRSNRSNGSKICFDNAVRILSSGMFRLRKRSILVFHDFDVVNAHFPELVFVPLPFHGSPCLVFACGDLVGIYGIVSKGFSAPIISIHPGEAISIFDRYKRISPAKQPARALQSGEVQGAGRDGPE